MKKLIILIILISLNSCASGTICVSESDKKFSNYYKGKIYNGNCPKPYRLHKWLFLINSKS